MDASVAAVVIGRRYRAAFGTSPEPSFGDYMVAGREPDRLAALGYRRADGEPLFLERYLDEPVEQAVGAALGRPVARSGIVEIGNFAADNALVMLELWGCAANDLAVRGEVAVATLTAHLRQVFRRIGLPFVSLGPARAGPIGARAHDWGSYYDKDPEVCAGLIAEGQSAIAAWRSRRSPRAGECARASPLSATGRPSHRQGSHSTRWKTAR